MLEKEKENPQWISGSVKQEPATTTFVAAPANLLPGDLSFAETADGVENQAAIARLLPQLCY